MVARQWLVAVFVLMVAVAACDSGSPQGGGLTSPPDVVDGGGTDVAIGPATDAASADSLVGDDTATDVTAPGSDDAAVGSDAVVPGSDDVAAGSDAAIPGSDDVAAGSDAVIPGSDDVAAGSDAVMPGSDDAVAGTDDTGTGSDVAAVNSAPVVTLAAPATNTVFVAGQQIQVSAAIVDPDDVVFDATVTVAGNQIGQWEGVGPTLDVSLVAPGPGSWPVQVVVTDGQGGSATLSWNLLVNAAPTAPVVSLSPAEPTALTPVVVVVTTPATDPDGEAASLVLSYQWFVNGQPVDFEGDTLPTSYFTKGDEVGVEVRAADSWESGAAGSASVEIGNVAPTAAVVVLQPAALSLASAVTLTCVMSTAATDTDTADTLTCETQWTVDGYANSAIYSASVSWPNLVDANGKAPKAGSVLTCTVVCTDGEATAMSLAASVTVADAALCPTYKGCGANATCADNGTLTPTCGCKLGYKGDGQTCSDIDECKDGSDTCSDNASCKNTDGSFDCTCNPGYSGDGKTCSDIDECKEGSDTCNDNASCKNTDGGYDCTCKAGYSGDGQSCSDIDECKEGSDTCDDNASCKNTDGSYACTCNPGYSGDGQTCTDDNECSLGTFACGTHEVCVNTVGSYSCTCAKGYTSGPQGCEDIDECDESGPGTAAPMGPTAGWSLSGDPTATSQWRWDADGDQTVLRFGAPAGGYNTGTSKGGASITVPLETTGRQALRLVLRNDVETDEEYDVLTVKVTVGGWSTVLTKQELPAGPDVQSYVLYLPQDTTASTWTVTLSFDTVDDLFNTTSGIMVYEIAQVPLAHLCDTNATCSNLSGSYACFCDTFWTGDGVTCTDAQECATNNGDCGPTAMATCVEVIGGAPSCLDVDECQTDNGGCGDPVAFYCQNADLAPVSCYDYDECTMRQEVLGLAWTGLDPDTDFGWRSAPMGLAFADVTGTAYGPAGGGSTGVIVSEPFVVPAAQGQLAPEIRLRLTWPSEPQALDLVFLYLVKADQSDYYGWQLEAGGGGTQDYVLSVPEAGGWEATAELHFEGGNHPGIPSGTGVTIEVLEVALPHPAADKGDLCGDLATCNNTAGGYACACVDGAASDGTTCLAVDQCSQVYGSDFSGSGGLAGWDVANSSTEVGWQLSAGMVRYSSSDGTSYDDGKRNSGDLTSPAVAIDPVLGATVRFDLINDTEGGFTLPNEGPFDPLELYVVLGQTETLLAPYTDFVSHTGALTYTYDLTAFAGQFIRLRWRFDTGDEQFNTTTGLYLLNLHIGPDGWDTCGNGAVCQVPADDSGPQCQCPVGASYQEPMCVDNLPVD